MVADRYGKQIKGRRILDLEVPIGLKDAFEEQYGHSYFDPYLARSALGQEHVDKKLVALRHRKTDRAKGIFHMQVVVVPRHKKSHWVKK